MATKALSIGSVWRRWDPHIHTPGTLLNDQYVADWEPYLKKVEGASPAIEVLGITDYFCIRGYQEARKRMENGSLQKVRLLFPNVEMRLDIKTEKAKGINIHLLFSPHDPDHESQILRLLGQLTFEYHETTYTCTPEGLVDLGRSFSGNRKLEQAAAMSKGAEQFKTSLKDIRKLMRDRWAAENCLVAVAAKSTDGTAGLQSDPAFAALREEIERFSHIVFSSNPGTREFWLGRGSLRPAEIERRYRFLKPCMHGCDAHHEDKIGAVADKRYTWVKGDPTFEALRQAVIEPQDRMWIGEAPPKFGIESQSIAAATLNQAPWFKTQTIPINAGLVAIIGARGSGKTALADVLAVGTHAINGHLTESSFLKRATEPVDHVGNANVRVSWRDGSETSGELDPASNPFEDAKVRYLSQQFVDSLCSSAGLAVELRRELERVVFDAIDPIDRLTADNFTALSEQTLRPTLERRNALRDRIVKLSLRIGDEDILRQNLPALQQRRKTAHEALERLKKEMAALVPEGQEQRARNLAALEGALQSKQAEISKLKHRQKRLRDLAAHVQDVTHIYEPQRLLELKGTFSEAAITESDWDAFGMTFVGQVNEVIDRHEAAAAAQISFLTSGDLQLPIDLAAVPPGDWNLEALKVATEQARKEVGTDVQQQKRYGDLSKKHLVDDAALKKLDEEVAHAEGSEARRAAYLAQRRTAYLDVFKTLVEEEIALRLLYEPLEKELQGASGALAKLKVVVQRKVDVGAWAQQGEECMDLRQGGKLRGKGSLRKEAESSFRNAWAKGTPDEVASAMETFRNDFSKDLMESIPKTASQGERSRLTQRIAAWLYDTSHIHVEYGIEFDGTPIENLSPGTRGIVLLLLYLAIDKRDLRPLIVDKPEENLDPQSVFEELVPHFKVARKRRQVVLVTHNANLVVNTDADQVIVASAVRSVAEGLPDITYRAGALEDADIRQAVCNILEGGHRAFLERERRYRFRWDDMVEA